MNLKKAFLILYYGKLTAQFPLPPRRIVYTKAGTLPACCLLEDATGIVDHMLYWMLVENRNEGQYLAAILNSETARQRVAALQARPMGRTAFRQVYVQSAHSALQC